MSTVLQDTAVWRFRDVLSECLGLAFDDDKLVLLRTLLHARLRATSQDSESYLGRLATKAAEAELAALIPELTVPETYFFRNHQQFCACRDVVIPERLAALEGQDSLRLLSAGCASGEEAYSLAILMREIGCRASVLGVDLNPVVLERARRAQYGSWALREISEERRQRWFLERGQQFVLDESIRDAVQFQRANLNQSDCSVYASGPFDVIFCRNMLMYFGAEAARAAIGRLTASLRPGGYLFLGHAETLRGVTDAFRLCHTHGTFYYQLARGEPVRGSFGTRAQRVAPPAVAEVVLPAAETHGDWCAAIGASAQRIQALATASSNEQVSTKQARSDEPSTFLELLRLMELEDFSGARELLERTRSGSGPDVSLVEAALLVHEGDFAAAETICERLAVGQECDAGVHYLLALSNENRGDIARAIHHDRLATTLDPSFGIAHLHWGLMHRKLDHLDAARDQLQLAKRLLQYERSARLVLFSGGFSRATLVELCRTQLEAWGARP